ncbi:MAG: 5'/3'-nucleotidase SurE, partial [Deltaproteobacteria bacterium]|nr:5'/3'-nucleotidase SurE [Deltaproteobacteria bacterium]
KIYSGTVAGAMEGLIQGISAVSFSLASQNSFNFDMIEPHVDRIVSEVIGKGLPPKTMLNVNFPDPAKHEFKGARITRLGRRFYSNDIVKRVDPRGGEYLWIGGTRVEMENDVETDCGAVLAGYVSVTPLSPDITGHSAVETLKEYDL